MEIQVGLDSLLLSQQVLRQAYPSGPAARASAGHWFSLGYCKMACIISIRRPLFQQGNAKGLAGQQSERVLGTPNTQHIWVLGPLRKSSKWLQGSDLGPCSSGFCGRGLGVRGIRLGIAAGSISLKTSLRQLFEVLMERGLYRFSA